MTLSLYNEAPRTRGFLNNTITETGRMKMKFKIIVMIAAMIFAFVPMVIFAVLNTGEFEKSGNKEYSAVIGSIAKNQSAPLSALISSARADIDFVAGNEAVVKSAGLGSASDEANAFLENFVKNNPLVVSAVLVRNNGEIFAGTNAGDTIDNYAGYSAYKDNALYFNNASGKTTSGSTMIIRKGVGQLTAMISYDISSKDTLISRICGNSKFYQNGEIDIVDSNGSWSSGEGYNKSDSLNSEIAAKIKELTDDSVTANFTYIENDKSENVAAMIKIGGEDGLVAVVKCPTSRAVQFSRNSSTMMVVWTVVFIIISGVAAIIVSGIVTSPLKKIQKTLEVVKNGDHEARISNMNNNEYGQLSRAFNNLIDDIVVSEDRYKNISEMSDNIIFEWNFKTNEVVFSNNFNKKFSYRAPSNHFGDSFLLKAKVHPDDLERYRSDLDQLEKGKNFERNEYRIKNIYGDFIWVLIRTATLKDNDGKPVKVVGVMVDIDRGKKSEQQLTERASFDALTELYNRETIENQIDNEISLSEMRKSEMAVLFIDVDDFKHYNDNYSHATGDQVLKFLAKTIKTESEGIGFAGRYGGDEFIVLLRDAETNDPALFAQRVIAKLNEGFDADIGERLTVSVSIGIALIKDNYNTRVEYLIGKADDAMYSVKKSGKSNYAFIN